MVDAPSAEVYDVPLKIINRPLPPILNEAKVCSLMATIQNGVSSESGGVEPPPIAVLHVEGKSGQDYYLGFGGCHRFEAHKRLGKETVRATITEVTRQTIKDFLGGSCPKDLLPDA
eukprot:GDKI01017651.1.p3 GENE.GDKI01017651.1~~GDKI01017651.1.p3  ORF type:complete len:116 (-),score=32.69 GDKI01017651.1:62-409(-)